VTCCADDLSELMNLLKTSDNDGVRRQARGTLEVLGVAMETRPTSSVRRLSTFPASSQPAAAAPETGQ